VQFFPVILSNFKPVLTARALGYDGTPGCYV
jgi:hypothetical protein